MGKIGHTHLSRNILLPIKVVEYTGIGHKYVCDHDQGHFYHPFSLATKQEILHMLI